MKRPRYVEGVKPLASASTSADRDFYDITESISDDGLRNLIRTASGYYRRYERYLAEHFKGRTGLRALELGAGSCCLSLLVSKNTYVSEIVASDISTRRMRDLVPLASRYIASTPAKLRYHEVDFSAQFDFEESSFDLVMFDGALHHSRSMWNTLAECRRILRDGGLLVAQRELYLGTLVHALRLNQFLLTDEVRSGVSENAYLKKQYEYYFRASGFDVAFLPAPETTIQKLMSPLNGLLHSKWVIFAKKTK